MRLRRRAIGPDISEESEPEIAVEPSATRDSTPDTDAEDDAEVNDELEADMDEEDAEEGGAEEDEEDEGEDDIEVDVEGDEEVDEMQESDDDAEDDEEVDEEEVKPRAGASRATRLRSAGGKFSAGRTEKEFKSTKQQHLRIKLKLPAAPSTANTSAAATPEPVPPPKGKRSRQARTLNIESEEEEEEEEDDDEEEAPEYPRGISVAGPSTSTRPMTTRQAVLASVVDSSHVSLDEGIRRKKVLNETELALRREETARKRKNLSEKKLENEKAETINRLLKKQSRSKNRRGGTGAGPTAAPSTADTPNLAGSGTPNEDEEAAEFGAIEEAIEADVEKVAPPPPMMYRWVSSVKNVEDGGEREKSVNISFSVPVCALPEWMNAEEKVEAQDMEMELQVDRDGDVDMGAATKGSNTSIRPMQDPPSKPTPPPLLSPAEKSQCAVPNCGLVRKYRLVKDFNVGACGMVHLKLLENMSLSSVGGSPATQ